MQWLDARTISLIHDELIVEHGGLYGIRDKTLLESALARPRNLLAYSNADVFALAAAYAWGITKNHPFVDGNKRAALASIAVFLGLNDIKFAAVEEDAVLTMLDLAAGKIEEEELADWVRANSQVN